MCTSASHAKRAAARIKTRRMDIIFNYTQNIDLWCDALSAQISSQTLNGNTSNYTSQVSTVLWRIAAFSVHSPLRTQKYSTFNCTNMELKVKRPITPIALMIIKRILRRCRLLALPPLSLYSRHSHGLAKWHFFLLSEQL